MTTKYGILRKQQKQQGLSGFLLPLSLDTGLLLKQVIRPHSGNPFPVSRGKECPISEDTGTQRRI
jgi:hypothetical protein